MADRARPQGYAMLKKDLIDFEQQVAEAFERCEIRGPIHLSGVNETQLIDLFANIEPSDWVLSTWRSHYHALLHGVPPEKVMAEIMAGRSMMLHFPEYRFMTSAIVGGMLPIACGLAAAGETVWCFVGDMCASTGAFHDAQKYANRNAQVNWVIEDNGLSTNTPTDKAWGELRNRNSTANYTYRRSTQHCGTEVYVAF